MTTDYLQGGKDIPTKNHKLTKSKKNHYKKLHCSPKQKKSKQDMSCLNQELLYKISEVLNKFHGADIKGSDSKDLYEQICNKMDGISKCKSEKCWLSFHELIKKLSSDERKEFKDSFDKVLLCTGRIPNTSNLNIKTGGHLGDFK